MKTIYLHVGNFKTGTSAIQKFCSDHRSDLLDCGFDYLSSARPRSNNTNHGKIPASLLMKFGGHIPHWYDDTDKFSDVSQEVINEINNSQCDNIIISSEEFYRIAGNKLYIVESAGSELRKLFLGHQVRVIIYIRKPLELLKSWYNQASKSNKPLCRFTDFFYYLNNSLLIPQINVKFWKNIFGKDCLIIESYNLNGSEHIHRFFDLMGAEISPKVIPKDSLINKKRNEDTLELDRISRIMLLKNSTEREVFLNNFTFKNPSNTKLVEKKIDFINRKFLVFCRHKELNFSNVSFSLADLIDHEEKVNPKGVVTSSSFRRSLAQFRDSDLSEFIKKIRGTFQ